MNLATSHPFSTSSSTFKTEKRTPKKLFLVLSSLLSAALFVLSVLCCSLESLEFVVSMIPVAARALCRHVVFYFVTKLKVGVN